MGGSALYREKTRCSIRQMRSNIIAEAREWIGTPYHHQAMLKGVGCDCVGFVVGVGIRSGALDITDNDIKSYSGYGRVPNPSHMRKHMERFLVETDEPEIGDIIWLQWRHNLPMHLAILSEYKERRTIIHSFRDAGGVVEHNFNDLWDNKVNSYWRFGEIDQWQQ